MNEEKELLSEATWPLASAAPTVALLRISPQCNAILIGAAGSPEYCICDLGRMQAIAYRTCTKNQAINTFEWGWVDEGSAAYLLGTQCGSVLVMAPDKAQQEAFKRAEEARAAARDRLASIRDSQ